jgi:hypothetical protein
MTDRISLDPEKVTLKQVKRVKQLIASQPVVTISAWQSANRVETHVRERMKKEITK